MSDHDFGTERDRNSVQDTPVTTSHKPNTNIKVTIANQADQTASVTDKKTKDLTRSGLLDAGSPAGLSLVKLNPSQSAANKEQLPAIRSLNPLQQKGI